MSKSIAKTKRLEEEKQKARAKATEQESREDECKFALLDHLEETLTSDESEKLMKNVGYVQVKHLFDSKWRVNFWTVEKIGDISTRRCIIYSFFIEWDKDFSIGEIKPDIKKTILEKNNKKIKKIFR